MFVGAKLILKVSVVSPFFDEFTAIGDSSIFRESISAEKPEKKPAVWYKWHCSSSDLTHVIQYTLVS
jgi:hypothetical protein